MKQIFFIGDTSNRRNWGCRATTLKFRELIESVGEIRYTLDTSRPHAKLSKRLPYQAPASMPSGRPTLRTALKNTLRETVSPLMIRWFPSSLEQRAILIEHARIEEFQKLAALIRQRRIFPNIAAAMEESDAVFINGEGSFMKNRTIGRFKLLLAYTAKVEFGKRVAIANHSADIRHPEFGALAEAVYPVIDDALFRERYSLETTGRLRVGKPHGFAADSAFLYEPLDWQTFARVANRSDYFSIWPEDARTFDPTKPYICVGGSSVYLGQDREFPRLRQEYIDLCLRLQKLAPVVLTASSQPDDSLLRPVAAKLGLPFLGLSTPVQQAVDILGNAAVYVGGRWHPGIMALTGGTPLVSFSANTDYKSNGLIDLAGLTQPQFPALKLTENLTEIVNLTERHMQGGSALRSDLLKRVSELRRSCADNVRMINANP